MDEPGKKVIYPNVVMAILMLGVAFVLIALFTIGALFAPTIESKLLFGAFVLGGVFVTRHEIRSYVFALLGAKAMIITEEGIEFAEAESHCPLKILWEDIRAIQRYRGSGVNSDVDWAYSSGLYTALEIDLVDAHEFWKRQNRDEPWRSRMGIKVPDFVIDVTFLDISIKELITALSSFKQANRKLRFQERY